MTVDIKHNGIEISDIIDDRLVRKLYVGYDKEEAIKRWENETQ